MADRGSNRFPAPTRKENTAEVTSTQFVTHRTETVSEGAAKRSRHVRLRLLLDRFKLLRVPQNQTAMRQQQIGLSETDQGAEAGKTESRERPGTGDEANFNTINETSIHTQGKGGRRPRR